MREGEREREQDRDKRQRKRNREGKKRKIQGRESCWRERKGMEREIEKSADRAVEENE